MSENTAALAARMFLDTKSVLFNSKEPFKYVSGNIGPVYVDCRRPLSFPEARSSLMALAVQVLHEEIKDKNIDIIAGAETAGIPYGTMIADRMEKPFIYVRKKPKGHGRMSQIEGHFETDTKPHVVLTEDLQNFGHSKKVFVDALREAGAEIEHFFVLFDYGIREDVVKDNQAMGLTQHSLCNWWDVLNLAREDNYFDASTLDSVELYLKDSESWLNMYQKESA